MTNTNTAPRPLTIREVRVTGPDGDGARTLTMTFTTGGKVEVIEYRVVRTASGYTVSKLGAGGKTYAVTLGTFPSCDCDGQRSWGHRSPCRHISALTKLSAAGRI